MKILQAQRSIVANPTQFVRSPTSIAVISTPFRIGVRLPSSPPTTRPSLDANRLKLRSIFASATKTPSSFHRKTLIRLMTAVSFPLPCLAAGVEEISSKINVESIIVSLDGFFNRYPYFVASLAFVWLVAIPLTQEYMNKFKPISCVDAFRKLKDDPSVQLLDIRTKQSATSLRSPNLKSLSKNALNLEFVEGSEGEFIKEALKSFPSPGNTIVCVLDNFDGNSLKVAKLLVENGFKEAYAIKGGVLGKDGWKEIQEKLLPPSLHVYQKRSQSPDQAEESREGINDQLITSFRKNQEEQGHVEPTESLSTAQIFHGRPLSPYPNYEDLKPPSSPSPSSPTPSQS